MEKIIRYTLQCSWASTDRGIALVGLFSGRKVAKPINYPRDFRFSLSKTFSLVANDVSKINRFFNGKEENMHVMRVKYDEEGIFWSERYPFFITSQLFPVQHKIGSVPWAVHVVLIFLRLIWTRSVIFTKGSLVIDSHS